MASALTPTDTGWQRNVWALTLTVFVAFVGFQFFSPFLPLYVHELGVTDPRSIALWSGVLAAVTPAVSGLLGPLVGRLADRFGRKMMLIRSLGGFVVIIAAMGLVTSVQQFLVARVIQGFFAGFTPMAMALASVSAPVNRVPTVIAMLQSAQLLSNAVGPAAGGYVASRLTRGIPAAQLLMLALIIGGPLCAAMALARSWPTLLVLRVLVGLCLGGAITLAYTLGAEIVPSEHRGAAFGWLAFGLQFGTAASPLVTGGLAAVSLPGAYLFYGVLAWLAAALLAFGARGLRTRRERPDPT